MDLCTVYFILSENTKVPFGFIDLHQEERDKNIINFCLVLENSHIQLKTVRASDSSMLLSNKVGSKNIILQKTLRGNINSVNPA